MSERLNEKPEAAPGVERGKPLDLDQFQGFTPGPWLVQATAGKHQTMIYSESDPTGRTLALAYDSDTADASLMAAAPSLLAECKRQREEIARLRAALQEIVVWSKGSRYPDWTKLQATEKAQACQRIARAALQQTGGEA